MPDAGPVIRVTGLKSAFGEQVIHENLDLEIRRGEVMGIVGGSGSGKSVLIRTIIGLREPQAGKVELFGQDVGKADEAAMSALRARFGMLFQDGALFSSLSVLENIMFPIRERYPYPARLLREIAEVRLGLAELRPEAGNKKPSEISGGMRKRAGLARALALDPELLLLDEPTAGLDPITAAAFDDLIRSLQQSLGLTVVMVTHDMDTLIRVTDRIAVLVDRHTTVGTVDELRRSDHPWIKEYFGGARGRAALVSAGRGE